MIEGPRSGQVQRLLRAARAAALRLRVNAALRRLTRLAPVPLGYAVLALGFERWAAPNPSVRAALHYGFVLALLVPLGAVLRGWWSARSPRQGALALDRHHQSQGRITSALEFSELTPAARTPFMDAAISDALQAVTRPSPSGAVPLRLPRASWWSVALGLLVVGLVRLPARLPTLPAPLPVPAPIEPVALSEDDLGLLRESARELEASRNNPELSDAVARFNHLVEELAEHRVDRRELFQKLAEIERSLGSGSEADALDAGLRDLAAELAKSPLSRPIAEALKQGQLPDAERALRELAKRLTNPEKVDRPALDQLRKALEAAAAQASGRVLRLDDARRKLEEEQRRLLQKKSATADAGAPPSNSEQERQRRRLEHLDRERSDAQRSQQALSQLDRDLANAARDLMKELGKSGESLQSGAEDVNRMAKQQLTDKQKQELKQRLEEMKELLRQGGPGREEHLRRLREFAHRARGKQGEQPSGEGQSGQGPPSGANSQALVFGPDGMPLPVPSSGQAGGTEARPGQGQGQGQGPSGNREWGSGSDPKLTGAATHLKGKTLDVTAAAVDTGQGAASSEVVFGAAERGFTGTHYQKVYTQYRTVAEDVLERETIPAGYEFYVRRYFQLIRPRETP
jgi:hypothetical protein